jgi:EpsI family protein
VVGDEETTIEVGGARQRACWLMLRNAEGERRLALFWYETRWGTSSRELDLKFDLLRSALARHPTDAALVRLSADVMDGEEECRARLESFLAEIAPRLDAELPFPRAGA